MRLFYSVTQKEHDAPQLDSFCLLYVITVLSLCADLLINKLKKVHPQNQLGPIKNASEFETRQKRLKTVLVIKTNFKYFNSRGSSLGN